MKALLPGTRLLLTWISSFVLLFAARGADPDTVTLILIDGDVRQDWPDAGVVGVHRSGSMGPLVVNFAIAGTAVAGTDYVAPPNATSITIPDGDREAWLEFAPKNFAMSSPAKTIVVRANGIPLSPAFRTDQPSPACR